MRISSAGCVLAALAFSCAAAAQRLQFAAPVTVPISHSFSGPYAVATGDLNGDGIAEIIIGQLDGPDIVIVPGSKDGRYRPAARITVGAEVGSLALTYFDGGARGKRYDSRGRRPRHRGVPDIVAGCALSNSYFLLLLRGHGDLTFTELGRIPLTSAPKSVLAADLNGDGRVDLAVTQRSGVTLFFGNGDGTFQPPVLVSLSSTPCIIRSGDFDGNGTPDLAVGCGSISVLLNKGNGEFQNPIAVAQTGSGFTVADFDGDGHLDLAVITSSPETLTVLNGDGTGHFKTAFTIPEVEDHLATAIESADIDGDGLPDVIVGHYYSGLIRIYRNQGGRKMSAASIGIKGDMYNMALADVNGDGHIDLIVPSYSGNNVAVGYGRGDATFAPVRFLGSGMTFSFTGDLDRDGNGDVAVLDNLAGCLHVLRRGSELVNDLCVDLWPYTAVIADFNNDGIPDFAISYGPMSWSGPTATPCYLSVFLGNGDFTFRALDPIGFEPWASAVVPGDFNGDGMIDLASSGVDGLMIHLGKGDGTFESPHKAFPSSSKPVAAADFDRDGKTDLLVTSGSGPFTLSVLLNSGDGTFRQGNDLQKDNFISAFLSDLNGDGISDVVASTMAKTYVFTGKGDGTFTSGPPLIRPTVDWSTPYLASTVDVDGDGSMDVIIPHGPSNSAYVFFGKRDGTFEDPVPVPAGRRPMSVAAADFDGDGRTDLVFASAVSGTVTILKTSPGLAATAAVTPQPAARSDPVRRAPGMPHPWWMETVPR